MARNAKPRIKNAKAAQRTPRSAVTRPKLGIRKAKSKSLNEAARLAAIVESSDDAILSKSLDGTILTWNAAAERMFGYSEREAVGKPITLIIPKDRIKEEAEILSRIVRGLRVEHFETERLQKSGGTIAVSLSISPVRDERGKIVGASKIARDITDKKAAENRQRMLAGELDHRVKNTMAVVSSLATSMLESSLTLDDFGRAFEGRLLALARAHRLLSETHWDGTTMQAILERVVAPVCRDPRQLIASGNADPLAARVAPCVALVLHELATNAAKYGAFVSADGVVSVRWTLTSAKGTGRLQLEWIERNGPVLTQLPVPGFGTDLVRESIEHEFGGTVEFEYPPQGVECRFDIAWSERLLRAS